jgi:ABC-type transport system substrate-binding protein
MIQPSGTLMTATHDIRFGMGIPRFNQVASLHKTAGFVETPFHIARDATGNYITEPRLAMSFEVSPDLKYADVKIRQGVQFHKGWGELTTEDVAWSYNDSSARTNPESVHDTAGDLAAMFLNTEAIDNETVRFNFNVYASNWAGRVLSDFWEGPPVYSKKVFDALGVEGMRNTIIGTGPFQIVEYTQSKQIVMEAFQDHWDRPSYVERAVVLEVPEDAARRAMMETGEVAITNLPVKDWPDLLAKPNFKQAEEGYYSELALSFGGNWWDDTAIVTGEPIERTLDMSKPWVGDINDSAQWERARLFREALGYGIDRESLNQGLLNGLGRVGSAPGWPKEAPGYKEEWSYGYDIDRAKAQLAEAGYGDGATVDFWVGPSGINPELGEAIAGIWEVELGIKTNFDKTQYNSTFRPSIIKRSVNKIWFCGTDGVNVPNLWPKGFLVSTVSNGGFMCGTEMKRFGEIYLSMSQEGDPAKLLDLATEFHDELRRTSAQVGVIDAPFFPLYNSDMIAEWHMHPEGKGSLGGFNSMWNVKLK